MNRQGLSPHARRVLLGKRQCIGTSRNGMRCRKSPLVGAFVCEDHGGNTPLSQKATKEFLNTLRYPALEVLYRATRNAPPCDHCGRSDADRDPVALKAAIAILDRTGFHPTLAIQAPAAPTPADYRAWIPQDRMDIMSQWLAEARAACERNDPLPGEQRALEQRADEAEDAMLVEVTGEPVEAGDVDPANPQGLAPPGEYPTE